MLSNSLLKLKHQTPIFLFLSTLIFVYGLYALFIQLPSETNTCQMTYTRGAHYTRVKNVVDRRGKPSSYHYKYNLYRFDQVSERAKPSDSPLQVRGIPVLFIPGHLGDYKQVRSLGSLSDEIGKRRQQRLEYFSLDFREEPSALSGTLLEQQASYVNDAVMTILRLYKTSPNALTQKSVVLVGHSMGGFVARRSLQLDNHQSGTVQTIVTISSPHTHAPHAVDGSLTSLWHSTNHDWMLGRRYMLSNAVEKFNQKKELQEMAAKRMEEQEQKQEQEQENMEDKDQDQDKQQEQSDSDSSTMDSNDASSDNTSTGDNSTNSSTSGWFTWLWAGNASDDTEGATKVKAKVKANEDAKRAAKQRPGQQRSRRAAVALGNVTLVSIAGGRRDNLMDANLATVKHLVFPDRGFSVLTKDVPDVEMSVDHACQVWCKQLLHAVTSGLYDSVHVKSGRMHMDVESRVAAMSKHLLPKVWAATRASAADSVRRGDLSPTAMKILDAHDHVHVSSNTSLPGAIDTYMMDPIVDIVRQHGSMVLPVATAIVALSMAYQLYVRIASTETQSAAVMPSFRQALSPERHLLHVVVGTMCAWLLGSTKEAHSIRRRSARVVAMLLLSLFLVSTPTVQSFYTQLCSLAVSSLPLFISDVFPRLPALKQMILLDWQHPPMYVICTLYFAALSFLYAVDIVLDMMQSVSTAFSARCFQPIRRRLPNAFLRGIEAAISAIFGKYAITMGCVLVLLFISCAVGPLLRYDLPKGMPVGPSFASLLSPTHLVAAIILTTFCATYLLCLRAALETRWSLISTFPKNYPKKQQKQVNEELQSRSRFLRSMIHLNLCLLPLHIPAVLVAVDTLRTNPVLVSWDVAVDLALWRSPCIIFSFFAFCCVLLSSNGPKRCASEAQQNMKTYVIGNETFQYDYRTGPTPSVSRGMRLAYWRVEQMKKLDKIFHAASDVRQLLNDHTQKIVDLRDRGLPTDELSRGDNLSNQKVHTVCLGILDKYQKLQLSLDAVSSVPTFDDQPPCAVVRGRRKAMQKEVVKQLQVGDTLKALTRTMHRTLEKMLDTSKGSASTTTTTTTEITTEEISWPELNVPLPTIPQIVVPPVLTAEEMKRTATENVKEEKTKDSTTALVNSNNDGDATAYYGADAFDTLTGSILVALICGIGYSNFLWNLTAMYRSLYYATLVHFALVVRYHQ